MHELIIMLGLLAPDVVARAQDLKEDLEVIQTEIELNNTKIIQTRNLFSKLLKKGESGDSNELLSKLTIGSGPVGLEDAVGGIFFNDIKCFQLEQKLAPNAADFFGDCALRQMINMLLSATFSAGNSDETIKTLSQQISDKQVLFAVLICPF